MANYKIDWDAEYPDGFLSYYGTRHMPKVLHTRLAVLAKIKETSVEKLLVECLEKGLDQAEIDTYMPEIKMPDVSDTIPEGGNDG